MKIDGRRAILIREKLGMSIKEMAEHLKVTEQSVRGWEGDRVRLIGTALYAYEYLALTCVRKKLIEKKVFYPSKKPVYSRGF